MLLDKAILLCFIGWTLLCISACDKSVETPSNEDTSSASTIHFDLILPDSSNIDFANNLAGARLPIPSSYVNVYNGAGVAIGDINNDGLEDIYLLGNVVANKLYLNKGDFVFEDISLAAGVEAIGTWCNGAVFTDINNDGYQDIYVSAAFHRSPEKRKNLLFINQGDNTFQEQAEKYGIADTGFSIQSSFFDYDRDGDNDLFIGNHPLQRGIGFDAHFKMWNNPISGLSDKLYRNNGNGTFTDVTEESGILNYGWTLSFITADFNDDGWSDIYVANDHAEPDRLYINQKDGSFVDEIEDHFQHISFSSMGSDMGDINNDGNLDLFTAEMLSTTNYREKTQMAAMNPELYWNRVNKGYKHQIMRNMLQLKVGEADYSEIAQMSGIHRSDWSWSTLFFDANNDQLEDLFIANGYYRDVLDKDFKKKTNEITKKARNSLNDRRKAMAEAINNAPATPVSNLFYQNNGELRFHDVAKGTKLAIPSFSSGAAYADFNNDGRLDLVVNNIDASPFLLHNSSPENNFLKLKFSEYINSDPVGTTVKLKMNNNKAKKYTYLRSRGYASGIGSSIHVGLGGEEGPFTLEVQWPNGKYQELVVDKVNTVIDIQYQPSSVHPNDESIDKPIFTRVSKEIFTHRENDFDDYGYQVLLPHQMSTHGPFLSTGKESNSDKHMVYISGAHNQPGKILLIRSDGSITESEQEAFDRDKIHEDMGSVFFDADGDKDLDIYVVSGGNEFPDGHSFYNDRLYLNEGGTFVRARAHLPPIRSSGMKVISEDVDADGDLDLIVGGRHIPHQYPKPASSYILLNDGRGKFSDETETLCPSLKGIGMITDIEVADINQDGERDLLLSGEWSDIKVLLKKDGKYKDPTEIKGVSNHVGWWFNILTEDIDSDGDIDIVAGNLGENYKYQASEDKPFHIYGSDFDQSGSQDIVLGYYVDNETLYPVRGRQCSSEQIPEISEKFKTYDEFASASLIDIYGEELDSSISIKATNFTSGTFVNDGSGNFEFVPFPAMAQISPINGLVALDVDGDGQKEIVSGGNLFEAEVETGRADAGKGLILHNMGQGNFIPISIQHSGINEKGNTKDILALELSENNTYLFFGNNDGPVTLYELSNSNLSQ